MIAGKLSCIIPFCVEYPQVLFTIRSIIEELHGRVDFEIVACDNYCGEVKRQGVERGRDSAQIKAHAELKPFIKYVEYDDKLSHWGAKRKSVEASDGEYLWFCDAHCMVGRSSLFNMFTYFKEHKDELDGTMHLPLTYHIMEDVKLIYTLRTDFKAGVFHYSFMNMPKQLRNGAPFEVPVMSTCGMMMTRELYDKVGGWPYELGIYGGGENFINFTLAVMGKKKWIYPARPLYHHGEKRSYYWNATDYFRNRVIALYISLGVEYAEKFADSYTKLGKITRKTLFYNAATVCQTHRELVEKQQVIPIEEWVKQWEGSLFY